MLRDERDREAQLTIPDVHRRHGVRRHFRARFVTPPSFYLFLLLPLPVPILTRAASPRMSLKRLHQYLRTAPDCNTPNAVRSR